MSKDEQRKLEDAIENVETLKQRVKKEMAMAKVMRVQEHGEKTGEKVKYMVIKAREQVNEAVRVLFSKDSKLYNVGSGMDYEGERDSVEVGKIKVVNREGGMPLLKTVVRLKPENVRDIIRTNVTALMAH